jgi:hypothetical protein
MAYTTIDKGSSYFNTKLYTGNGSTQSVTGVGFKPDWVWIKNRSTTTAPVVYDAVRGATKDLYTSATDAEGTNANGVTSFNSDGFSVGSSGGVNGNTQNIVAWNWLGANTTVSNTAGTITSTVSANTTSGFSIVTFTSTGSTSTVGHGLGVAPAMIIGKRRDSTSTWTVGHQSLGWTKFLRLEDTTAVGTETGWWNNTNPTSSVFTHGTNWNAGTWVAYCFAEIKGFSKFGSYTGNGSTDGTFIYTGFKPAFFLVKNTASGEDWEMWDNARDPFNVTTKRLKANLTNAEATSTFFDFVSNGIKMRNFSGGFNSSGGTFIYMAFAENPFVSSKGIPTIAR